MRDLVDRSLYWDEFDATVVEEAAQAFQCKCAYRMASASVIMPAIALSDCIKQTDRRVPVITHHARAR